MWRCGNVTFVPLCGTLFRLHKTFDEDQDIIYREQGDFSSLTFSPGRPLTSSAAFCFEA
jgi:hypothetical protein